MSRTVVIAISLIFTATAATAQPLILRCKNVSPLNLELEKYVKNDDRINYVIASIDLDNRGAELAFHHKGGVNQVKFSIVDFNDNEISGVSFHGAERRLFIDRITAKIIEKMDVTKLGPPSKTDSVSPDGRRWYTTILECTPTKRII